jgi:hypothetical protein
MAALTTCIVGGLMPQARHGGIGVREASAGSKLEGTGFEKEQIGQIQDALREGAGAGLLRRSGEPDEGLGAIEVDRPRVSWLAGLGKRVILGEDLRKPAYVRVPVSQITAIACFSQTYIELRLLHILQEDGHRVLARLSMIYITHAVGGQVGLAVLVLWDLEFAMRQASVASSTQSTLSRLGTQTYPSYNPTASCTNKSVSSGKSDGRKAVVRSSWCRNIQAIRWGGMSFTSTAMALAHRRSFGGLQLARLHPSSGYVMRPKLVPEWRQNGAKPVPLCCFSHPSSPLSISTRPALPLLVPQHSTTNLFSRYTTPSAPL